MQALVAIVVLFIAAVLLIGPAFILPYSLQERRLLGADDREPQRAARVQPAASVRNNKHPDLR